MKRLKKGGALLLLALLSLPAQLHAASPFDIDIKELDRENKAVPPKTEKKKTNKARKEVPAAAAVKSGKGHAAARSTAANGGEGEYLRYTIKPGDHIFKILVGRFGMSNEAAERLIPEILRINKISNIRTLTVGHTLLIPGKGLQERLAKSAQQGKNRHRKGRESEAVALPRAAAQPEAKGGAAPAPPIEIPLERMAPPPPPEAGKVASAPAAAPTATVPAAPVPAALAPKVATATVPGPKVAAPASEVPAAAPATPAFAAKSPAAPAAAPLEAPAVPAIPLAAATPVAPQVPTWICSVTETDPAKILDAIMNALSLHWSRNRIVQSEDGALNAFSIRVDRYFELNGTRYIVSIGGASDPYSYTLLRLLEEAGYRVLMINPDDDFNAVGVKLLRLVGMNPDFGLHVIQGKESTGFLVPQDDAEGRRVMITREAVNPKQKWILPAGCGSR